MKPKVVLVPLDGSTLAERALEPATAFVRDGGTLVLLRASEVHASLFGDASEAQVAVVRAAETYLEGVAARARRDGVKDVQTSVWYGAPVEAIADTARYRKADLIVMSTHGRSGLGRLMLGSVAESALRKTSVPILLLRSKAPAGVEREPAREAARYRRVLVPLDGSDLAASILPFLTDIAGPLDMRIVLLRVVEPIPPMAVEAMATLAADDDVASRLRGAEEYLAPVAVELRARGIETTAIVRVGRAEEEILAAAQAAHADLIAMSTHGRSGLGRLLLGSVAEQVLRHAEVPIFMMRHAERRNTMLPMKETTR